jgi:transporter family protein
MLVWLLFTKDVSPLTDVPVSGWIFITLEGICAALIGQLLYYYALKSGNASIVVPLIASFPLFTFIIATLFLGDKISITKVCEFYLQ